MKLDDLKAEWQSEIATEENTQNLAATISLLAVQTSKLDKSIKRRDIAEIFVAVLLLPFWVYLLFNSASLLQSIGALVWIFCCIFIPYKLLTAKKITPLRNDSMIAFLEIEKEKVNKQKKLLETIFWWYILPCLVGIVLVYAGASVDESGLPIVNQTMLIYFSICGLMAVAVYFFNHYAANKKFQPLLDNINDRLKEMKE